MFQDPPSPKEAVSQLVVESRSRGGRLRPLRSVIAACLTVLGAHGSACAQSAADPLASIERVDASWNELRLKGDVAALREMLADDWLLTHSDGRVENKTEYLAELSNGVRRNQGIVNHDVKIRLYPGTAIVTGGSIQSGLRDGVPWSGKFRFTRVWVLEGIVWRMVASHSSRIPD